MVVGPLRVSRFGSEGGGLWCNTGNGSVRLADSVERSPWTVREGVLVARLIWVEAAAVVAAPALLAALTGELVDAEFPRPRRSASDFRNPAVLPDKRYKNTVCPDCLTFNSCKVSWGLGIFLPTIHFCTWTGKPYLSNTCRRHEIRFVRRSLICTVQNQQGASYRLLQYNARNFKE